MSSMVGSGLMSTPATCVRRPVLGLVVPGLDLGGGVPAVAKFVLRVAQSNGINVKLISLSMASGDPQSTRLAVPGTWFQTARVRGGSWQGMPFSHVGAEWGELEFQRYRRRPALASALDDCDLIQVVCGSPAWAKAVVGMGKPVGVHVATRAKIERRLRDASPQNVMGWWRKGMTEVTDRLDDRALRAVDAIQLMNPWMLDYSRQINRGRTDVDIRYAPPGVDARLFCPLPERLRLASSPYILCVGRLDDPRKNISLLLHAFRQLPASLLHVHLVTAGAGRPPPDYWAQVEAMGLQDRVRHIQRPETADLVKLYQQATVFALPSDEEGFGMVVIEAMACGVPVVATRCGGPDGIITDDKDGFLVSLDDVAAMADRLALLCTDTDMNQQMGREARATIGARYAEDVAGAAFVDVWDKLLQKAGER